jgi:hypothetical protein
MSDFSCPSCGTPLTVRAANTPSPEWKTDQMQTFALGDGAQIGAFKEMTRTMPTRHPTREGDVIVPLAQAFITALCVGILAGIITLWQGLPWPIPFVAFSVILSISWWWLLLDHRSLLRVTERVIGRDIDGDGFVGPHPGSPAIEPQEANITYTEPTPGGLHMERDTLKISPAELAFIGRQVILEGCPFSKAIVDGETITENRFRDIQAILREKGYARYKNPTAPKQGAELTKKGKATLRWYAVNWEPTPLP